MTVSPLKHWTATDTIAQGLSRAGLWQADRLAPLEQDAAPVLPTGHSLLDAELPGGGWPCGAVTEVLQTQAGWHEWRLLRPGLCPAGKPMLLVGPPHWPHLRAFMAQGIAPGQLLLARAQQPAERLWVIEQALHCSAFGLVLCWLPQARAEQLRRLQLAARDCAYPVFLFRPMAARHESSPAPLRLALAAPSPMQLELDLFKRRGPALGQPLLLDAPAPGLAPFLAWRARRASPLHHVLDRTASCSTDRPSVFALA
jgi:protein ImuA